jgi:hypothetical protein
LAAYLQLKQGGRAATPSLRRAVGCDSPQPHTPGSPSVCDRFGLSGRGSNNRAKPMRRLAATLVAILLTSFPASAADGVPVLNVKPTCQAGEVAAVTPGSSHLDTCLQSENAARDQLRKGWAGFPASDRTECVRSATIGYPSYVDLLTCLEMRRHAREPQTETTGTSSNLPRRQPTPDSFERGSRTAPGRSGSQ